MAFAAALEATVKDFANKDADYIMAEYLWIDGDGGMRSKTKVIRPVTLPVALSDALAKCPDWNFDGSSTKQAPGEDSEVVLKAQAVFRDPFRGGSNILVMCDCYTPAGVPIPTNTRNTAAKVFAKGVDEVPWFGIEQEYTLFQDGHPLGWPRATARAFGGPCVQVGFPGPQGPYYCSAGADVAFGRVIADSHMKACLYAGMEISGINGEVMPGQWEYQVGPCIGIASGDQLWASRYVLLRVCEEHNVVVSFDPKPIPGDWNGAGCHTNYSTKKMREQDNAYETIMKPMLEKLESKHKEHIAAYGEGNELRLTGGHETASIDTFSWGVANRGASVRIGNETAKRGKGYMEDRRPASNMDPYVVTSMIFNTTVVQSDEKFGAPLAPNLSPKPLGSPTGRRGRGADSANLTKLEDL